MKETGKEIQHVNKYEIELLATDNSSNSTGQFECVATKLHPSFEEFIKAGCT